jgi:hypothetical protein
MSFLFKSKKHQSTNPLPPATRNIHTSEGTTSTPGVNGFREKDGERLNQSQSPTPSGNMNSSLSSLNEKTLTPDHQWQRQRERADSDIQVSPIASTPQLI